MEVLTNLNTVCFRKHHMSQATPKPKIQYKRKYPRRIFYGTTGVLLGGKYTISSATTVGEGGLSFIWKNSIPNGTEVVVSFKLPGELILTRKSEVRNSRANKSDARENNYIIGIQFNPLTIAEKRKIRSYVSSRSENEPTI